MNILVLQGSPRKQGNTAMLVDHLCRALAGHGRKPEVVRLAGLDIHPCIGCGHCEQDGECVFRDGMVPLLEKIVRADRIVLASPVYFYGVTAQCKVAIDRCQALWSRKYVLGRTGTRPGKVKKGYLLSVAATRGDRVFDGVILTARYALDAMDCRYSGELLVRGVDKPGAILKREKDLARAADFARTVAAP